MMHHFQTHPGYIQAFQENKLTLGLIFPLESYEGNIPVMNIEEQIKLAKIADASDFASLFVRDVPLNDPSFGDVGQMFDPWIYLSHIAAHTKRVALGTASAITSFQHPLNLAKSAASMDNISGGRLLFGLATGDRPVEFDAYRVDREKRVSHYQEALYVMRKVWSSSFQTIDSDRVHLTSETDLLPKPVVGDIPVFVTGFSGQTIEWIAEHSDGWLTYSRPHVLQERLVHKFRERTTQWKPFAQSLSIDIVDDPTEGPTHIQLGFKSGRNYLIEYLHELKQIGVNHVILGLKNAKRPADEIIQELVEDVAPHFPALFN